MHFLLNEQMDMVADNEKHGAVIIWYFVKK